MQRRQFLKGALYGTGGTLVALSGLGAATTALNPRRVAAAVPVSRKTVYSSCEMCRNQCPIAVKVENGKVVKIDGNPNDSAFGGVICARGNSGPSLLYDPERIKKPMIRTGERGSGKFKEVSWDEAYTYIAQKLKAVQEQYGGEAVAQTSHIGPYDAFFQTIGKAIGSPNLFSHEATCPMARIIGLNTTFGTAAINADYANTKYLLVVGRNFFEGIHVAQTRAVAKALSQGTKMVVLDPRFSVLAAKGEWLPIKGTTDLAFMMALANVLIDEKLYDEEFIKQYTVGFDKWAAQVKDKTPAWAAKETGISQDTIIRVARELAQAKPHSLIEYGWRTTFTADDFQLRRAIMIVNMMLGNFEVPGGYYQVKDAGSLKKVPAMAAYAKKLGPIKAPSFPKPKKGRIDGTGEKGTPRQLTPIADGAVGQITETILTGKPYPIKAWLVHRFNPVMSIGDTEKTLAAIKRLDLLVTCDLYMSDTAYYSDVVLPECTYLERTEQVFDMSGLTPKYVLRQQAVDPVYPDTKPAWQIYKELGEKMGYGQYFPYKDIDDYVERQLAPTGISRKVFAKKGLWTPAGMKPFYVRSSDAKASLTLLATKSKKIEIFSDAVQEATGDGVPVYVQYPQPGEGEFRLIEGKVAVHTNVGTHNVPVLHELMPENTLWINAKSAAKLGLKTGDAIVISAGKYEHKGTANVTEGIRPDTVFCYHGFGQISPQLTRAFGKGINDNKLIPDQLGLVGNSITSMTFVKVRKA
ncbi:polysulfide reductase chain A precursor [Peptococcaceae bacterium CEB3]|nr:polysulfide reductase chain A precursor [Peptococcaceae bacterium CEB3]